MEKQCPPLDKFRVPPESSRSRIWAVCITDMTALPHHHDAGGFLANDTLRLELRHVLFQSILVIR
jgi:hypothetical protein